MTVWKTSNTPYGSTAVPREKKKEKGTNSVSSHSLTSMLMLLAILIVPSMGCKPTLSTEFTDLLPAELTKLLLIPTYAPLLPALTDVKGPQILFEPEGSGVEVVGIQAVPILCTNTVRVELQTTHPWNTKKLVEYGAQFERDFRRLQRYSRTPVDSFGGVMTRNVIKIQTMNGSVYGQRFVVDGITAGCSSISEFVRKAVSWSSIVHSLLFCRNAEIQIYKAILSCRCEQDLVIQKV